MRSFSPVNDAMEGFGLIGRRPGAVAVWVLLWIVLAMGPMIAGVVLVWPQLAGMISEMQSMHNMDASGPEAFSRIMAFQGAVWSLIGPWLLWLFVAQTILNAAVFRAILEPRSGGFFGLKLGMDEVRQFLLQILLVVLFAVFAVVLACLMGLAVWGAHEAGHGMGGWLIALAVIACLALCVYVPIKLSLAAPMTFAKKRIEVFGSWRVTRGRFWSMLGMLLIVMIFMVVISVVVGVLRNVAILGFSWDQLQGLDKIGDDPRVMLPALMHAMGPGLIVAAVIQGVAAALMRIIGVAPLAAAYRDLSGAPAEPAPAAYDAAPAHS